MLFWCLRSLLSMIMSASTLTGKEGENNGVGSMKLKCRSQKVLYRHRVTCTTRPWSVCTLQTRNPTLGIWVLRGVVEWTSASLLYGFTYTRCEGVDLAYIDLQASPLQRSNLSNHP